VATGATALIATAVTVAVAASPPKAYTESRNGSFETTPLLSVGDVVKETSGGGRKYQMIGIPDGLGAVKSGQQTLLYMNHELGNTVQSQPVIGGPVYRGAFVSQWTLNGKGKVVSGQRAYDTVFVEDTEIGPAAETGNSTPGFSRFCSGSIATTADGFTEPIYLAGEETEGAATFSGEGGQAVAIFDNEAHVLPALGRMPFENIVAQRRSDTKTVLLALEDGPSGSPWSNLYMYVGERSSTGTELQRNGLVGGKLFALAVAGHTAEAAGDPVDTTLAASWVEIPGASAMSDTELGQATLDAGAFGFARVEDGAFDKTNTGRFYFVTTGQNATVNNLGRIYQLDLDASDPTGAAGLKLVIDADTVAKGGGDTAISPDNIDTSASWLMVQEDGTTPSRARMSALGRDGSIWRFPITGAGLVPAGDRLVELDPPGRDGTAVGPGVWETSGIIDASTLFGPGTWLYDVQAHAPTNTPDKASQVEDGQLLLLRPDK
jgi:hypothetical protein